MSPAVITLTELAVLFVGCAVPLWRMLRFDPRSHVVPPADVFEVPDATFDHGGFC